MLFEIGYIPLLCGQIKVLGCVPSTSGGGGADGAWVLAIDRGTECFGSTRHRVLACLAVAAVLLLYPLSMAYMFAEGQNIADPIRYLRITNLGNQFIFTGIALSINLVGATQPGFAIGFIALSFAGMGAANYWYAPALGRGLLANNLRAVAFAAGTWTGACGCVSYATRQHANSLLVEGSGAGGAVAPIEGTGAVMWAWALGLVPAVAAAYAVNARRARKFAIPSEPLHTLLENHSPYVRYAASAAYAVLAQRLARDDDGAAAVAGMKALQATMARRDCVSLQNTFFRLNALLCTATARILIPAECSAILSHRPRAATRRRWS